MTRRARILEEMGLGPQWLLREAAPEKAAADPSPSAMAPTHPTQPAAPSTLAATAAAAPARSEEGADVGRAQRIARMDWEELKSTVAACRDCALCRQRRQAVLGVGDVGADWLFVGEGPGAEEDERGEPFVGQAGRLLDNMLAAIGLKRGNNVYIANVVKCRPPGNRTPEPQETAVCFPYLARQIALIEPRLIVALGRPAAQSLLDAEVKIAAARGRLFEYRRIPVIVTYHPAYLLRNLPDKAKAWEDLCFAHATMRDLARDGTRGEA
ncbi:MAG: uracil-DNA glycosylase [Betaproteobacteria bacterium]|nr:uracil-DNA glycosylase [Betaproteobacteria bacterium]